MGGITITQIIAAAFVPVLVVVPAIWWFRWRRRDEVFTGITPGELPGMGHQAGRERVRRGSEWSGPVAVRFTPPDGMTPGLAGTVVDGRANAVDVSSTLVDLAVRGHLRLSSIDQGPDPAAPPDAQGRQRHRHDWLMERVSPAPQERLLRFEAELLTEVFRHGRAVTIGQLKQRGFDLTMRKAQIGLYREVVDRGWYKKHPRDRNRRLGCLGWPLALVAVGLAVWGGLQLADPLATREVALPVVSGAAGLLMAAVILLWGGRGRTPRTAEGSAARIQTLGFERYLPTAEAGQIRFEEARDVFSRYLPYAIVFGVADRWAKVFAEVAARARMAGFADTVFDLTWLDGLDVVSHVGDVLTAVDVADLSAGVDLGDIDIVPDGFVDAIGDGLGGVVESVGDFVSSATGLLGTPGCGDGCDGCDAPGCDW